MRNVVLAALVLLLSLTRASADADDESFAEAVLYFTGASCLEDLTEDVLERYDRLRANSLKLNAASESRLLSSGLFSQYQVASLLEYRRSSGDVLSLSELSLIDGFPADFVRCLAPFVSLESKRNPGQRQFRDLSHSGMARLSCRKEESAEAAFSYGFKYSLEYADRFELNWASRTTYSSPDFDLGTLSAAYYGSGALGKIVVGNFSARFGQGLVLWSGTTIGGLSSPSSFVRSGSLFGASQSFSPSFRGVAADFDFGRTWAGAAFSDNMTALLAAGRRGGNWTVGLTLAAGRDGYCAGADARLGFRGGAVYSEIAFDGAPAGILGVFWIPSYGSRLSALLRCYSPSFKGRWSGAVRSSSKVSDECALSLGAQNKWAVIAVDACLHPSKGTRQLKGALTLIPVFEAGPFKLKPSLRVNVRYSPDVAARWRVALRPHLDLEGGAWRLALRFETVSCKSRSFLGYLEPGYVNSRGVSVYARAGFFRADNWDDRIYVYERDAPGNFTSPAFYGRGWWGSVYAGAKVGHHSFYLRLNRIAYPFMEKPKPFRTEVRLQYGFRF